MSATVTDFGDTMQVNNIDRNPCFHEVDTLVVRNKQINMSDGEEICSVENYKARWVKMECGLETEVICFIWSSQ